MSVKDFMNRFSKNVDDILDTSAILEKMLRKSLSKVVHSLSERPLVNKTQAGLAERLAQVFSINDFAVTALAEAKLGEKKCNVIFTELLVKAHVALSDEDGLISIR